jgi:hypothetical protein
MKRTIALLASAAIIALTGAALAANPDVQGGMASPTTNTYAATASHQVEIDLPTVVALEMNGGTANSDLVFKPSASDVYNNIGASATPILPDASGEFQSLMAYTNDPSGAALTIKVSANGGNPDTSDTLLNDVSVNTATGVVALTGLAQTIMPSAGPVTVFDRNQVSLKLSGTETPGTWIYDITYTLTAN